MPNVEELKNRIYEINRRFCEQAERLQIAANELEDSEYETRFVMDQTAQTDVRDEAVGAIGQARAQALGAVEYLVQASNVLGNYADSL